MPGSELLSGSPRDRILTLTSDKLAVMDGEKHY